jgi:epoxyqueuosine reductase
MHRVDIQPGSNAEEVVLAALRASGKRLGLDRVAIADPKRRPAAEAFDAWLARGDHAGMGYLARRRDERIEPERFFPGVGSIVCVAWSYHHPESSRAGERPPVAHRIARYAWGSDYHDPLRARLEAVLRELKALVPALEGRVAVDTPPVLERHWAAQAGLGWIGRNGCLIVPGIGSWVFLGEIFLNAALPPGEPLKPRCGTCQRCIAACPGGALRAERPMDARRCVAYWTIEHRGAFPTEELPPLSPWIFGCDVCQEVCPWNTVDREQAAQAAPTEDAAAIAAQSTAEVVVAAQSWCGADWERLGQAGFAREFGETPLARAGYPGILRNVRRLAQERTSRG